MTGAPLGLPAGEEKPRAITRTEWQHDPESRRILFIVPRENSVVPRVWGSWIAPRLSGRS